MALELDLSKILGDDHLPDPIDYDYWKLRNNRIFNVDYELEDSYEAVRLGQTILLMNKEEKDIPKDELKPITLVVFSYGGDLSQCQYLMNIIINSRIPIITVANAAAMSSGFMIFLSGHKRYMFEHGELLIHQGAGQLAGNANEIREAQKSYENTLNRLGDFILERTKIDAKTLAKNKNKDWYLTAADCVKYEIGEIITPEIFEQIFCL